MVKINIAYPPYGSSQLIEVDDEKKWRVFLDKRMSEEVPADSLGDEFKGYVFKITGGYDKQGFAMMQGVMLNHRTRLLLDGRTGMYTPKRKGCRKRKSVRGCIIAGDMSCINVIITKRGEADLPKLTDKASDRPSVRGPKRAANIRKAWGLTKKDDVRQYVIKKTKPGKDGKKDIIKSPKIQRLITPVVKQRRKRLEKAHRQQKEKARKDAADYAKLLMQLRNEKRSALLSKRRELKSKASTTATKPEDKDKKPAFKRVMKNKTAIRLQKSKKRTERLAKKGITKPTNATEKKATEKKATEKKVTEKKVTEKKAQPTQKKTATTASTGKKAATKPTKK